VMIQRRIDPRCKIAIPLNIHYYVGHILNHILTSRGRVQRNNKRAKETEGGEADDDEEGRCTTDDQGHTRPTSSCLLLPTRDCVIHLSRPCRVCSAMPPPSSSHATDLETEYGPVDLTRERGRVRFSAYGHRKMV
jgi:hypothetical protein